ncbi:MAG: DNA repair protein RecN [Acidimicrobiales bacterium]
MLHELSVRDLGVIADVRLVLSDGMTALTGETGAGKTLLVDAIDLLVGGRADPTLVRPGADEAVVEGRFVVPADPTDDPPGVDADGGRELVLTRVVPASGRSRAYIDGRLATAGALADWGRRLVDLHGQHAHQSLLATAVQRDVLDRFADVDLSDVDDARRRLVEVDAELAALGGDERARAREIDLYRFQVDELDAASLTDPDEDERLDAAEDLLADAVAHQGAAAGAVSTLSDEGGAVERVATALGELAGRVPFAEAEQRLRALLAELEDVATTVRQVGEGIDHDPERLDAIRSRRQLLSELRRKYGATLGEVITYADQARTRLAELEGHDARAARLDEQRHRVAQELAAAHAVVGAARRAAAPDLAGAVERGLVDLGMTRARVEVHVGAEEPGDDVEIRLSANPGAPPLPLTKTASGGELARAMLAIRLVLTAGPPVLVFDEVDAGIGGEAATAVGAALARVGVDHQVLVVTHLAQVAAHASQQVSVAKRELDGTTVSEARVLTRDERVVELSRMLSGRADSDVAREHAGELLSSAGQGHGR